MIIPSRIRPARWPLVRGPRHQFSLGGLGSCSSPGSTPCCGCPATFTVKCGATAVNGATVTIKSGSTTISSGTTNSSGQVTLTIPSAGTYTVVSSGATCTTTTQSLSLACNGSYTLQCCTIDCGSCGLVANNPTIYVTDSSQTTACATNPAGDGWIGCYNLSLSAQNYTICGCNGLGGSSGCATIKYKISCSGSTISVERDWYGCSFGGVAFPPHGCGYCCETLNADCSSPATTCGGAIGSTSCDTNPGGTFTDVGSVALSSCSPFPVSLTLTLSSFSCTDGSGATLTSPLGSGITINS